MKKFELKSSDSTVPNGVRIIEYERNRQINEEGWTDNHDNEYKKGELALAAMCYAAPDKSTVLRSWPWDSSWWKPTPDDRIRELAKAGALIAAEIDRLLREMYDD